MTNGVRGEDRSMERNMGILCELRLGERVKLIAPVSERDLGKVFTVAGLWVDDEGKCYARCACTISGRAGRRRQWMNAPVNELVAISETPSGDDPPPCPI